MLTYIQDVLLSDDDINLSSLPKNVAIYKVDWMSDCNEFDKDTKLYCSIEQYKQYKEEEYNKSFSNYDYSNFAPKLNKYMLNNEGYYKQVYQLNKSDVGKFIRSDSGEKLWSGQIINDEILISIIKDQCSKELFVFLCEAKKIDYEFRLWIGANNIKELSLYPGSIGQKIDHLSYEMVDSILLYLNDTQEFANYTFQYKDIKIDCDALKLIIKEVREYHFPVTLDIAMCNDELKIVELNCYYTSGFYNGRIEKIIKREL